MSSGLRLLRGMALLKVNILFFQDDAGLEQNQESQRICDKVNESRIYHRPLRVGDVGPPDPHHSKTVSLF